MTKLKSKDPRRSKQHHLLRKTGKVKNYASKGAGGGWGLGGNGGRSLLNLICIHIFALHTKKRKT